MPLVAVKPVCLADNVALADPMDKGEGRFHAALPSDVANSLLAELVFLGRVDIQDADALAVELERDARLRITGA